MWALLLSYPTVTARAVSPDRKPRDRLADLLNLSARHLRFYLSPRLFRSHFSLFDGSVSRPIEHLSPDVRLPRNYNVRGNRGPRIPAIVCGCKCFLSEPSGSGKRIMVMV